MTNRERVEQWALEAEQICSRHDGTHAIRTPMCDLVSISKGCTDAEIEHYLEFLEHQIKRLRILDKTGTLPPKTYQFK